MDSLSYFLAFLLIYSLALVMSLKSLTDESKPFCDAFRENNNEISYIYGSSDPYLNPDYLIIKSQFWVLSKEGLTQKSKLCPHLSDKYFSMTHLNHRIETSVSQKFVLLFDRNNWKNFTRIEYSNENESVCHFSSSDNCFIIRQLTLKRPDLIFSNIERIGGNVRFNEIIFANIHSIQNNVSIQLNGYEIRAHNYPMNRYDIEDRNIDNEFKALRKLKFSPKRRLISICPRITLPETTHSNYTLLFKEHQTIKWCTTDKEILNSSCRNPELLIDCRIRKQSSLFKFIVIAITVIIIIIIVIIIGIIVLIVVLYNYFTRDL